MGSEENGSASAAPAPLLAARRRLTRLAQQAMPPKPKRRLTRASRMARANGVRAASRSVVESVTLLAPHWINGVSFGPGVVRVPSDVASMLRENERRLQENNAALEGRKAAYIGPRNRVMPVPYELFDSPMLPVLEAMILTKD